MTASFIATLIGIGLGAGVFTTFIMVAGRF